jgi:hypothetical protein
MTTPSTTPSGMGTAMRILSVDDVKKIIADAQVAGTDPVSVAMQVFSGLGDQATVTGANLRDAFSGSAVPLTGPLTTALGAIQKVTKAGNLVTLSNNQEVKLEVNGTQVRLKQDVSLEVAQDTVSPALNNITGVSVHKFLWIDIHSIQLQQNQGQKIARVVTSGGTKEFPVG